MAPRSNDPDRVAQLLQLKISQLHYLTDEELEQVVKRARDIAAILQGQSNAAARLATAANKQLRKRR